MNKITYDFMKNIKFIKPLLSFFILGLLITTISRIVIFFLYKDRIVEVENYWNIFPIGLRFDVIMLSYLSLLPALFLFFLPHKILLKFNGLIAGYFIVMLSLFLMMELATTDFMYQYDTRPNRIFLDYLIYPKEIGGTLFKNYLGSIISTIVVLGLFVFLLIRYRKKLFYTTDDSVRYGFKLMVFPVVGFLLFFGARGSLVSKRPINESNAMFSTDHLTNTIGLNSLYTVIYAAYSIKNEQNAGKMYGEMEPKEAFSRVKKYMNETDFIDPTSPLLHRVQPDSVRERPYNLVIFLQESLGAEYVGSLGGLPLTPEFDALTKEGLLFTKLYSTGTRSVRGIEAVLTGFLPSPSESVVKLSGSQKGFFTLASLFKDHQYNTSFIYGGMANFDNMASFFSGNGFENIIDQSRFDQDEHTYAMKGTWGYSDEDLAVKANEYFKNQGDKPFFSLMFSTSNHEPFEFPDGRIELYNKKKKNTVENAMKYADFAIGKFFELAKKEDYFKNTIFIVVADHNTRTYGKNLVPIHKFKIPGLIIGPNVPKGEKYTKLASQIDLGPSLLNLVGLPNVNPMPGRDLFRLGADVPGRAIMQFNNINAFRVEDQVVILQPAKEPLQFKIINDSTFVKAPLNKELAKDALAHVMAAYHSYNDRSYTTNPKANK